MIILQEINILNDKKLATILNLLVLVLIWPFFYLFTEVAEALTAVPVVIGRISLQQGLVFFLSVMLLMSVHELIHGAFFKLFAPSGKVTMGFKWKTLMAYAVSAGSTYNRKETLMIALAPFVLLSLGLTVFLLLGFVSSSLYVLLAAVHAAGCVGDFYYTYLLLGAYRKEDLRINCTETGIIIYAI